MLSAVDAALTPEELAARLEAPTVRPPSNPPAEEVVEAKKEVDEVTKDEITKDEVTKDETAKDEVGNDEIDRSREVDTIPPMHRGRDDEPIDERASGLPPRRSARFFTLAILVCAIGGAVFGIRKLSQRAPKAPVTMEVAPPPAPEVKAAPPPEEKPAEPAPAPPTGNAIEEREAARVLLEKRKPAEALPHAIRAVEIDPSDAQTWLVLGAAHQDSGHAVDARDTFLACTKKATTGPIHECRALLSYNGPR